MYLKHKILLLLDRTVHNIVLIEMVLFFAIFVINLKRINKNLLKFPFIFDWSPEGWVDFQFQGMYCAYFHFA